MYFISLAIAKKKCLEPVFQDEFLAVDTPFYMQAYLYEPIFFL